METTVKDYSVSRSKVWAALLLAATLFLGAIAFDHFIPAPVPKSSEVTYEGLSIPGKQCEEDRGYSSDEPMWNCSGTHIRAIERSWSEEQDAQKLVARQHRSFQHTSALPSQPAQEVHPGFFVLSEGEQVSVGKRGTDGQGTVFFFDGPDAEKLSKQLKEVK